MSTKLLDTNTVIELVRANLAAVSDNHVAAVTAGVELAVSSVSVFEFRYGIARSPRHTMQGPAFGRLLSRMTVVSFDEADAERTAEIKAKLARAGQMIGAYDLMIAGQALSRGWPVVTHNTGEFSRVSGLTIEDWSVAPT